MVYQQLRALAILDTAIARQRGYPQRVSFQEFIRRSVYCQCTNFIYSKNQEKKRNKNHLSHFNQSIFRSTT